jgi:hypothetical protein
LRIDEHLSGVILLDGYFDNTPNAVYRCVFRVQVEENPQSEEVSLYDFNGESASGSSTRTPSDWDEENDRSSTRTPSDWDEE